MISKSAKSFGLSSQKSCSINGQTLITCNQIASPQEIIKQGVPQRWVWNVAPISSSDSLICRFDQRWFGWYRISIICLMLLLADFWLDAIPTLYKFKTEYGTLHLGATINFLCGWTILFMLSLIFLRSDEVPANSHIEELRDLIRKEDATIESIGTNILTRSLWAGVAIIVYLVFILAIAFQKSGISLHVEFTNTLSTHPISFFLMAMLSILIMGFILLLVLTTLRSEASSRLTPFLPTMNLLAGIIFFMGAQIPLHKLGDTNSYHWTPEFTYRAIHLPFKVFLLLSSILFFCSIGMWFIWKSIVLAYGLRKTIYRLRFDEISAERNSVVSGRGFLRFIRYWAFLAIITIIILYIIALTSSFSIMQSTWSPEDILNEESLGAMRGLSHSLEFFIGSEYEWKSTLLISRVVCGVFSSLLPLTILVSVGTRLFTRICLARRLSARNKLDESEVQNEIQAFIKEKWNSKYSTPFPSVVINANKGVLAAAHCFGFLKKKRFIELSTNLIKQLDISEIKALASHELAHHFHNHCSRHNRWQLLGRITLLGGGAIGILEDSFGWELEADRVAVRIFGTPPETLKNALIKIYIEQQIPLQETPFRKSPSGLPTKPSLGEYADPNGPLTNKTRIKFTQYIRSWLELYSSDTLITYWHPSLKERIIQLNELSS